MAKGNKTGGAKKGSIKTQTNAVKEAVLRVFHDVNGDSDQYLRDMAANDPKLFTALFSKMIPQEQAIEHTVNRVDLGAAMVDAQARVDSLTIDHEPLDTLTAESSSMNTLSPVESLAVTSEVDAATPPPSRPYLLDEKFDIKVDEYGRPIPGDD